MAVCGLDRLAAALEFGDGVEVVVCGHCDPPSAYTLRS